MPDKRFFSELLDDEIVTVRFLTQGQIGPIYLLEGCKDRYLLKTSEPSHNLPVEASMLEDLARYGIRVPKVYAYAKSYLVTEYIVSVSMPQEKREKDAAALLAKLHAVSNDARMYGYWYDTTIGPYEQKNEQTQYNWALFYAQMRLLPMMRRCLESDAIERSDAVRIEALCDRLHLRLNLARITPSLIHGDLWSGNILFAREGAVAIDPAISFADREMELAFILMFDTFGKTFFEHYSRVHPLSEDFYETKVPLYQLYYYLVHAAIYGRSYLPGVRRCLEALKV